MGGAADDGVMVGGGRQPFPPTTTSDQIFILTAQSKHADATTYNVVACLDLRTGSSDLKKGSGSKAASRSDLRCVRNDA